jgi:hypothetical protein
MLTPALQAWLVEAFPALRFEAPSGLPPERGPDAMPGIPTEGDPPDAG